MALKLLNLLLVLKILVFILRGRSLLTISGILSMAAVFLSVSRIAKLMVMAIGNSFFSRFIMYGIILGSNFIMESASFFELFFTVVFAFAVVCFFCRIIRLMTK